MEKEKIVSLLNRTVRLHGFNRLYVLQKYIAYRDGKTGRLEHCVRLSEKNNPGNVLQIGIEKVEPIETEAESVPLPAEPKDELTENKDFIIKHFNRVVRVEGLENLYVLKQYIVQREVETGRLERSVQLLEKENRNHAIEVGIERVRTL